MEYQTSHGTARFGDAASHEANTEAIIDVAMSHPDLRPFEFGDVEIECADVLTATAVPSGYELLVRSEDSKYYFEVVLDEEREQVTAFVPIGSK